MPDLSVELRGDLCPLGLWRRTDAQGKASVRMPLAGNWLLRGVDLRLSAIRTDTWESGFVTLASDVKAPPR